MTKTHVKYSLCMHVALVVYVVICVERTCVCFGNS